MSLVDRSDGTRAVVAVAAVACPRCREGKGCGAGLLMQGPAQRHVEATIRDGLEPAVDDVVELTLAPDNLLRAALIVYGLPLAGATGGAAFGWGMQLGDAAAAGCALLGVLAGLVAGRLKLRRANCLERFTPSVEAIQ